MSNFPNYSVCIDRPTTLEENIEIIRRADGAQLKIDGASRKRMESGNFFRVGWIRENCIIVSVNEQEFSYVKQVSYSEFLSYITGELEKGSPDQETFISAAEEFFGMGKKPIKNPKLEELRKNIDPESKSQIDKHFESTKSTEYHMTPSTRKLWNWCLQEALKQIPDDGIFSQDQINSTITKANNGAVELYTQKLLEFAEWISNAPNLQFILAEKVYEILIQENKVNVLKRFTKEQLLDFWIENELKII